MFLVELIAFPFLDLISKQARPGCRCMRVVVVVVVVVFFFNFTVSRARHEKLCDFYWLQLRITCKSGWIAQAEKSSWCWFLDLQSRSEHV